MLRLAVCCCYLLAFWALSCIVAWRHAPIATLPGTQGCRYVQAPAHERRRVAVASRTPNTNAKQTVAHPRYPAC